MVLQGRLDQEFEPLDQRFRPLVGLMIPFETTVTRVLGVAALLAFVVCGVFLIADPGRLAGDDDDWSD